jgi:hypothetical protein
MTRKRRESPGGSEEKEGGVRLHSPLMWFYRKATVTQTIDMLPHFHQLEHAAFSPKRWWLSFYSLPEMVILVSSVAIATGYGLDDKGVGVRVPVESRIFCTSSRVVVGSTHWVPEASSPGVKRPVHEADHSSPTSA